MAKYKAKQRIILMGRMTVEKAGEIGQQVYDSLAPGSQGFFEKVGQKKKAKADVQGESKDTPTE